MSKRLTQELEAQLNFRRDIAHLSRLVERLTHWEIRQMEAMDRLEAAFVRHEAELAEVKEGLKKVVEVIKEVPADTTEIENQLRAFADRLDGSTADMDAALKESGKEPVVEAAPEVVVEPTPAEEVPTEVNPEPVVESPVEEVAEEETFFEEKTEEPKVE
jgi:septal ring factor EnvC (AmiA/AmiB activator)